MTIRYASLFLAFLSGSTFILEEIAWHADDRWKAAIAAIIGVALFMGAVLLMVWDEEKSKSKRAGQPQEGGT